MSVTSGAKRKEGGVGEFIRLLIHAGIRGVTAPVSTPTSAQSDKPSTGNSANTPGAAGAPYHRQWPAAFPASAAATTSGSRCDTSPPYEATCLTSEDDTNEYAGLVGRNSVSTPVSP